MPRSDLIIDKLIGYLALRKTTSRQKMIYVNLTLSCREYKSWSVCRNLLLTCYYLNFRFGCVDILEIYLRKFTLSMYFWYFLIVQYLNISFNWISSLCVYCVRGVHGFNIQEHMIKTYKSHHIIYQNIQYDADSPRYFYVQYIVFKIKYLLLISFHRISMMNASLSLATSRVVTH